MQINSVIPVIAPGVNLKQAESLISKLVEAGVFKATVTQRQQGQMMLDTPWGRISAKGSDNLRPGDEILARLQTVRGNNELQLLRHLPQTLKLDAPQLLAALGDNRTSPKVATFLGNDNGMAQLRVGQSAYRLPTELPFQKGDLLMLAPQNANQLTLKRIDAQTMLKAALTVLLPKGNSANQGVNTTSIQQLAQNILSGHGQTTAPAATGNTTGNTQPTSATPQASTTSALTSGPASLPSDSKTQTSATPPGTANLARSATQATADELTKFALSTAATSPKNPLDKGANNPQIAQNLAQNLAQNSGQNMGQAANANSGSTNVSANTIPAALDPTTKRVEQILQTLSRLAVDGKNVDGKSLQRIIDTLGIVSANASPTSANQNATGEKPSVPTLAPLPPLTAGLSALSSLGTHSTLPQQLAALAEAIRNQPDLLNRVLRQLMQSATQSGGKTNSRQTDPEMPIRNELLHQVENLLNQVTTQKVMLGMQQDSQQPLQIHLNIPIQIERETRELKLKISEQASSNNELEDSKWEVNLQFEFGGLGPITTRITLQGKKLSAHFWAEYVQTKTLIDNHLDQFRGQLVLSGFEPDLIDCFLGQAPEQKTPSAIPRSDGMNLLDLKA